MFWTRFGSPTEKYGSGTEEEIEILLDQGKQVFLYFSDIPTPPSEQDSKQSEKNFKFKKKYENRGIYKVYESLDEFNRKLTNDLNMYFLSRIREDSKSINSKNVPELSVKSKNENKLTDRLIFKKVNYTESKFISDKEQEILEKIESIQEVDIHSVVRDEDESYREDGGIKIDIDKIRKGKQKAQTEEERILENSLGANIKIPQGLRSIVSQLPQGEKVHIKKEEKRMINK